MQDKETTLVLKPGEAMPKAALGAAMDAAANIMARQGKRHRLFSRGVVKQAIRRKREAAAAAVIPGGGAKERARRLRQSAALDAKRSGEGHEDSSN